jgi:ankyrin repeat protein
LKEVVVSESNNGFPRHLHQQRKLAKDLLKAARAGDVDANGRLAKVSSSDSGQRKLADAQLAIARESGFESWPKLVKQLEQAELRSLRQAIQAGDADQVRRLLGGSIQLRKKINAPLGDFGARPINMASNNLAVMDVLLEFGADINLRSDWDKGPYGVLDACPQEIAPQLIARGAKLTAHAAARFGWLDRLKRIVEADPKVVHEKGGDGQRPLHYARTNEIAEYLLTRGAEIDARCVDHNSTAAQYALKDRSDVTRYLLGCGATADIFMPARLGDLALASRLIAEDSNCVAARTNVEGYERVPVFGIYNWVLGFYLSPHEVALKFEHRDVYELLVAHSPPKVRLLDCAMRNDAVAARAALREDPSLVAAFTSQDHSLIAYAALHNRVEAVKLMLDLGFDPRARGLDGGTVLHMAAWVGSVELIQLLLARGIDVHVLDPTHGSSPLSWAAYGSVHRRAISGDYPAVIELLVRAGADIKAMGNRYGNTMLQMADGNPTVQQVLRRLGAV